MNCEIRWAQLLTRASLRKLLDPSDKAFEESLEIIRQQASLMKRLVDDLLDVSRITSGRIELKKSTVRVPRNPAPRGRADGDAVWHRADILCICRYRTKRLRFPRIRFAWNRYCRICWSTRRSTPTRAARSGSVPQADGPEVLFRVRDSGIGIGPDLLPNVFDLFAQANRSLHRAEGGLGIGLTIVRGLAELHGGRVRVTSEGLGRGSEFVVALPATAETVESKSTPLPIDALAHDNPRRILVVEDHPALSHVTVALLRKLGHEVRSAADGAEALTAVKEYRSGRRAVGHRVAGNGRLRSGTLLAFRNGR